MKTIVIIPTYNEKENIKFLVEEILSLLPDISILVVDDNSPDGTSGIIEELRTKFPKLDLCTRIGDRGFGRSYIDGFRKVINDEQYEKIVTMDADFSHDPKEILKMADKLSECDVIIGSRYVRGGKIENWNWRRRLLSRFANFYVKTILGVPINDMTTGFIYFKKEVLENFNLNSVRSEGYAFLIELKYQIFKSGFKIREHPIVFNERREGQSKMSFKNIWEAVLLPWKLKLSKK
mgnify:FL=1